MPSEFEVYVDIGNLGEGCIFCDIKSLCNIFEFVPAVIGINKHASLNIIKAELFQFFSHQIPGISIFFRDVENEQAPFFVPHLSPRQFEVFHF